MEELSNLDEVKLFLFKEALEKRHILIFPPNFLKCSMDIRPPHDPTVGNMAMILVPTLTRSSTTPRYFLFNGQSHTQDLTMTSPVNIIIWNIGGGIMKTLGGILGI